MRGQWELSHFLGMIDHLVLISQMYTTIDTILRMQSFDRGAAAETVSHRCREIAGDRPTVASLDPLPSKSKTGHSI